MQVIAEGFARLLNAGQRLIEVRGRIVCQHQQPRNHPIITEQVAAAPAVQHLLHDVDYGKGQQLRVADFVVAGLLAHLRHQHGIGRCRNVLLIAGGVALCFLRRDAARQQGDHQPLAQQRQAGLKPPAQAADVRALARGLVQAVARVLQHLRKLRRRDGLEQVAQYLDLNGLPGVLKIIVPRQDDELGGGQYRPHPAAQGQPVHQRHADVGNHQVGGQRFGQLQRLRAVAGLAHHLKAIFLKADDLPKTLADFGFVVHQQQFVHRSTSLALLRIRAKLSTKRRCKQEDFDTLQEDFLLQTGHVWVQ